MSVRLYDFVYRDVFILVYICWFFTKNIIILALYIFYKHHSNSTSGSCELQFIFYLLLTIIMKQEQAVNYDNLL